MKTSLVHGAYLLGIIGLCLGGCATTSSDLKSPMDGFAAAAKASQTTLQSYDAVIDNAVLETNIAMAVTKQGSVSHQPGDCVGTQSKRCRLELHMPLADPRPLSLQPTDPVARQVMSEIVIYAGNLQAIAAVDTQSEVKNATDETLANLKVFAQTMDSAADKLGSGDWKLATTIDPYITPVSDAATYALGQGLEEEKIAALRKATTAMDSIFGKLMDICKASVDAGATIKKNKLQTAYNDADFAYQTYKTSRAKLDTLRAAAAAYDTALATDFTSQFDDLAKAHAALVAALKLPKPDFKSAWLALQQAIQTAMKIQGLMQEFEAAGKPSKT